MKARSRSTQSRCSPVHKDEELCRHPRGPHPLPEEHRVDSAEPGTPAAVYRSLNSDLRAMVDKYSEQCIETIRVVDEETARPFASGVAAGGGLVGFRIGGSYGGIIQSTPPWDRRSW